MCVLQGGGDSTGCTMSLAKPQGPPNHTPGLRLESPSLEEPSPTLFLLYLEATPQTQAAQGRQSSKTVAPLVLNVRVSLSQAYVHPQAGWAVSPTPQGLSL